MRANDILLRRKLARIFATQAVRGCSMTACGVAMASTSSRIPDGRVRDPDWLRLASDNLTTLNLRLHGAKRLLKREGTARRLPVLILAAFICIFFVGKASAMQDDPVERAWLLADFLCKHIQGPGCCGVPNDAGMPSGECACGSSVFFQIQVDSP